MRSYRLGRRRPFSTLWRLANSLSLLFCVSIILYYPVTRALGTPNCLNIAIVVAQPTKPPGPSPPFHLGLRVLFTPTYFLGILVLYLLEPL